jgi:hypothetical protein
MATNITVRDLDNYPDISKTITVDQKTLVPTGAGGDEKWVLSFVTTAYSDNTNRTAIQGIYMQEVSTGWFKSSGLVSLGSNFIVSAGSKTLGLNIDNSSKWYYIELDEETYTLDALAEHIEDKIREIPDTGVWSSTDDSLSYKNAQVEFDGKFKIISGTVSEFYTGNNRTSVAVTYSGADTLYYDLGFDLGIGSYDVAITDVKESLVTGNCGPTSSDIDIHEMIGLVAGDPMAIADSTHTEYFVAASGTTATNIVIASGTLIYSYTAERAKVQKLRIQDPDQEPVNYHSTIDSAMRWGIMSVINQIDFSS